MYQDACYTPAALATPEDLEKKAEIFERRERTVGQQCLYMKFLANSTDSLATSKLLESGGDLETWRKGSIPQGPSIRRAEDIRQADEIGRC